MHRTYSMRQSRAPTASQLQNPPPPPSSTKSTRFFGSANIGEYWMMMTHIYLFSCLCCSFSSVLILDASRCLLCCSEGGEAAVAWKVAEVGSFAGLACDRVVSSTSRSAILAHRWMVGLLRPFYLLRDSHVCLIYMRSICDPQFHIIELTSVFFDVIRPCLSPVCGRCLWAGPGQKTVAAGEDGKERHAQHGAGVARADGSCCMKPVFHHRTLAQLQTDVFCTATTLDLG